MFKSAKPRAKLARGHSGGLPVASHFSSGHSTATLDRRQAGVEDRVSCRGLMFPFFLPVARPSTQRRWSRPIIDQLSRSSVAPRAAPVSSLCDQIHVATGGVGGPGGGGRGDRGGTAGAKGAASKFNHPSHPTLSTGLAQLGTTVT